MNRQQRRNDEKKITLKEARMLAQLREDELKRKFDFTYSAMLITTLSAPPYNFGKKRMKQFFDELWGQIYAVADGHIEDSFILAEVEKYGMKIDYSSGVCKILFD